MHFITAPFRLILALLSLVLMIFAVILIYLTVASARQRQKAIAAAKGAIARILLRAFNIRLEFYGQYDDNAALVVANHVSWLDVILLVHKPKLHFIAKSEVKEWPVIGFLTKILGTLFIRRDNKFLVYRALPRAQKLVQRGESVMVFPEGTTTIGRDLLPFYPMMYEIAVREKGLVQPIAIRYWNSKGEVSLKAAFIDDDGIMDSIARLITDKVTYAQVHFLPCMDASKMDRKELAEHTQKAIQTRLDLARPPEAAQRAEDKHLESSRIR